MLLDIRAIGFNLTDAIRHHVQARVAAALGPFASALGTVTVRLEDINANRGGIDKRCNLVAAIHRRGIAVAESVREDLYVAVDKAAGRIRRSVQRHLRRHAARQRKMRRRERLS